MRPLSLSRSLALSLSRSLALSLSRSLALSLVFLTAAPVMGQSILWVDARVGKPSGPGTYSSPFDSITAAVGAAQKGDTIKVVGQPGGPSGTYGYTDAPHPWNSQGTGENFPILLEGVTLKASGDLYIMETRPSSPGTDILVQVVDSDGVSDETRIEDTIFVGGKIGVDLLLSGSDAGSLVLDNVGFVRNQFGLQVTVSSGAEIGYGDTRLELTDCFLASTNNYAGVPQNPSFAVSDVGLRFLAGAGGRIWAQLSNFRTMGDFHALGSPSAIIDVLVDGNSEEHTGPGATPDPISTVRLDLNGGTLRGKQDLTSQYGAWSVGIRTNCSAPTGQITAPYSYTSAVDIRLNGTLVQYLGSTGIHMTNGFLTRGHLSLNGSSMVERSGWGSGVPNHQYDDLNAGITLRNQGGYMSFSGSDATVRRNWGHGVYAQVAGLLDDPADTFVPWGTYLGLNACEITQNGRDGLYLEAGAGGIVGGAWSFVSGQKTLLQGPDVVVSKDASFPILQGQGVLDRCAIHDNGFYLGQATGAHGIEIRLLGDGEDAFSCIGALRSTNTMLWHNAWEGYFLDLGDSATYWTAASPLVHCTVAGNGGASGGSTRNAEVSTGGSFYRFQWEETDLSNPSQTLYLNTKFLNTVFERQVSSEPDFGTTLAGLLHLDTFNDSSHPMWVFVRGLRTTQSYGETAPTWYSSLQSPFQGQVGGAFADWSVLTKEDLYLDPYHPRMSGFAETPNQYGLMVEPPEVFQDIQPILRPPLVHPLNPSTSERDKGAHQTPTSL